MADLPPLLLWSVTVIYGLALGSFTTCVAYRIPRMLSIWRNDGSHRSFCPHCKAVLTTRDLIPVVSWLMQKGRCRHCGKPIGKRYLIIELMTLAFVSILVALFGFTLISFFGSFLAPLAVGLWGISKRNRVL